jgi:myosin heavy chain 6/7
MVNINIVTNSQVKVESIDDAEEMQIMDEAFDILGFTHEEKFDVYKCSSTCMVMSR